MGRHRRYAFDDDNRLYADSPLTRLDGGKLHAGEFERYLRFEHSRLLAVADSEVQAIHRKRRAQRGAASALRPDFR
ncbi:MAG TPA: hypothetical protein VFM56_10925 [Solimonas sp.]|nr:hypothetical protein [Solimonas sp.]